MPELSNPPDSATTTPAHGHDATTVPAPRRHRGRWVIGLLTLTLAASAAGYAVWSEDEPTVVAAPQETATVPVTLGSMLAETTMPGTLQYAMTRPVVSGPGGTVTELPAVGTTITAGGLLYRVDTRPVVLLPGALPAWRDFAAGMSDGDDVRQLESALRTLGFFGAEPDARFTWATTAAVKKWQKALGVEQTGTLEKAMILFSDQDLRVDKLEARVGDQVSGGAPLYQASGLQQVVDLNLTATNRELAVPGTAVVVALPTGGDVDGTIESVGAPTEKPAEDGEEPTIVIPVRIALADQGAVSGLTLAKVTVRFASVLREDVLTVPVDALVPVDDTTFAVEVPPASPEGTPTRLPVTVGAFSSGNVEVSGDGVVEGLDVVVPTR